jgi:small subunit ribosomal protein S16
MLMIRMQRVGRRHEPVFRLVLTDSKNSTKSGRFLEILGHYDTRTDGKAEIKADRVKHWVSHGAKLSDTVHNLFVSKKVIEGKKINKLPKKKPILSEKTEGQEAVQTEETQKVAEETTV